MKILSNSFSVFFAPVLEIREYIFKFERELSEFNRPFTLIPVPDGAPYEIPRITATTLNGHSNLVITLQNAQVVTNYDDKFSSDPDKCWAYFLTKATQLIASMNKVLNVKIRYGGLTTIVAFDDDNPVGVISSRFLKVKSNSPLQDVATRLTYVKDATYYINMEIQNARLYEGAPFGQMTSMAEVKERESFLQVMLDLNDRYAFNEDSGYLSQEDTLLNLFSLSKSIVLKMPKLIEKGEIDFDGVGAEKD